MKITAQNMGIYLKVKIHGDPCQSYRLRGGDDTLYYALEEYINNNTDWGEAIQLLKRSYYECIKAYGEEISGDVRDFLKKVKAI